MQKVVFQDNGGYPVHTQLDFPLDILLHILLDHIIWISYCMQVLKVCDACSIQRIQVQTPRALNHLMVQTMAELKPTSPLILKDLN